LLVEKFFIESNDVYGGKGSPAGRAFMIIANKGGFVMEEYVPDYVFFACGNEYCRGKAPHLLVSSSADGYRLRCEICGDIQDVPFIDCERTCESCNAFRCVQGG
jgi:hypothetical protein